MHLGKKGRQMAKHLFVEKYNPILVDINSTKLNTGF